MATVKLDVKELLKVSAKLPTLPAIGMQIVKISNDPASAAADLSRLLAADQSLAAKVLKLVNSSYYGIRNKVSSVKQAVVILGFETVRSLALSTAVMEKFSSDESGDASARKNFWKHSLGVAMTSRLMARHLSLSNIDQEDFYMAGLLHDIGKVILDQHFHENYLAILNVVKSQGGSFFAAEKELHDISHDQIGGYLGRQWAMPPHLVSAIRYHHEPMMTTEDARVVDAVHFANILTKTKGMGSGGDEDISLLNEDAVKRLGMGDADIARMIDVEMTKEFDGAQELLQLFS